MKRKTIRILQFGMMIPYVFFLLAIWLTPLLRNLCTLIFSVDSVNGYQRGYNFWFYGLCVTKFAYLLLSFFIITYYHRFIPKSKLQVIHFFIFTITFTAFLQFFNYGLLVEAFGMSLVTLVYFFFLQKPLKLVI